MLLLIIRLIYIIVCTGAIATFTSSPASGAPPIIHEYPLVSFCLLMLFALSIMLIDILIPRKRVDVVSAIYFGLLIAVLLSYLLNQALQPLFNNRDLFGTQGSAIESAVTMMSTLIFSYLCVTFLLQTKDDFRFVIPYVEFARELKGGRPIVLDSSALIDGRIADVLDTHIIEAELVVPNFVLQEVQNIADSNDKVRRTRGRRGLDVLRRLQSDPKREVRVHETDGETNGKDLDQYIIELAKELNGRVVTNDYNLNKVAGVQGVEVVNLNDLANALKPRFIPGEQVRIRLQKEGEGPGQAIGYLDDGTMVVCEHGYKDIGKEVDIVVTSVLQNSAGRMIFGRPGDDETPPRTGSRRSKSSV